RKSLPSGSTRGWMSIFGRRSCSDKKLERDDDSKKSHPALTRARAPQDPRSTLRSGRCARTSGLENEHDLERLRIDEHDLVPDDEDPVAPELRIDRHDILRHRHQIHRARDARADADVDVDVADARDVPVLHRDLVDPRALFRRQVHVDVGPAAGRAVAAALAGLVTLGLPGAIALVLAAGAVAVALVVAAGAVAAVAIAVGAGAARLVALGLTGALTVRALAGGAFAAPSFRTLRLAAILALLAPHRIAALGALAAPFHPAGRLLHRAAFAARPAAHRAAG